MMTVKELIEALSKYPEDTPVKVWDHISDECAAAEHIEWDIEGGFIFIEPEI
jgi:hypothetical protein